jgi:hypothetical protein
VSTLLRITLAVLFCLACTGAHAQSLPTATRLSLDVSAGFTSIRANEGPGLCGCFFLNGGSGELAITNSRNTSFLINFARTTQNNINDINQNLILYNLLEGARYTLHRERRIAPFGEVLVGISHTASNYEYYKSTNAPALLFGGGVDINLGHRISVRPVDAGWLFTTHRNAQNNFQNQLRMSASIVFHIHRAAWE